MASSPRSMSDSFLAIDRFGELLPALDVSSERAVAPPQRACSIRGITMGFSYRLLTAYQAWCRRRPARPTADWDLRQLRRHAVASAGARVKIFLDDQLRAPPGWIQVRWPDEAIAGLATGSVDELSLDHDLGDDSHGTGYDPLD